MAILLGDDSAERLTGTSNADELRGGLGADTLLGGAGNDLIEGGLRDGEGWRDDQGNQLFGELGDDTLIGASGADSLSGGVGNNLLRGGGGSDHFLVEMESGDAGHQTIADFGADDRLSLSFYYYGERQLRLAGESGSWLNQGENFVAGSGGLRAGAVAGDGLIDLLWQHDAQAQQLRLWIDANDDGRFSSGDGFVTLQGLSALNAGAFAQPITGWRGGDAAERLDQVAGLDLARANRVFGEAGDDSLAALDGSDTLDGGAGNDSLQGEAGDDFLLGGLADDRLDGGEGHDRLDGGEGSDSLAGGAGADALYAEGVDGLLAHQQSLDAATARNELDGGDGNDTLTGGQGADLLLGGEGADVLFARTGSDTLQGGSGNDSLYGGSGTAVGELALDLLQGGDGDDLLLASDSGWSKQAWMSGGAGADRFRFSPNSGSQATHRILDFDALAGDRIDLRVWDGAINGLPLVWRGAAAAGFEASPGQSLVLAGGGESPSRFYELWTLVQGGNTLLFMDANRNGLVDSQDFRLQIDGLAPLDERAFADRHFLAELGGAGNDSLQVVGDDGGWLFGEAGDDALQGSRYNDVINGDGGNDALQGGSAHDRLFGGADDDWLSGDVDNDSLQGGSGDDSLYGGDGDDTLEAAGRQDSLSWSTVLDAASSRNHLFGEAGRDSLWGSDGQDRLDGGSGDDVLNGGLGSDWLEGGSGDDALRAGGDSNLPAGQVLSEDSLSGGEGNDLLIASNLSGRDRSLMHGGLGADRFLFHDVLHGWTSSLKAPDRIQDFNLAEGDRLDLGLGSGLQSWNPVVWRGVAQGGFDASLGQSLSLARGGEPAPTGIREIWTLQREGLSLLFIDRNSNGLVDETDFLLEFEGAPVLSAAMLGDANFGAQVGGSGADLLTARIAEGDLLFGLDGADSLSGGGGRDSLVGDAGDDSLLGAAGGDQLYGGAGADQLDGGDGDDSLMGGAGADSLKGGAGHDWLRAEGGASPLTGGSTPDTAGTRNQLDGGSGNDSLVGGNGDDELVGGDGDDRLEGYTGSDSLQGGAGADRFVFSFASGSTPQAADRVLDFNAAEGDRLDFELYGGSFAGVPLVWRGAAQAGFSAAIGQSLSLAGDSLSTRFAELWTLQQGGDTLLYMDRNRNGLVDVDDFLLRFSGQPVLDASALMADSITARLGTSGTDRSADLGLDGSSNLAFALGGDDSLDGGQGQDTLAGDEGADSLLGGEGHDSLFGGAGDDSLTGGEGYDTLWGGVGADSLYGGADGDRLYAQGHADQIGQGNWGIAPQDAAGTRNLLQGGSGNDALFGGHGDDSLEGGDNDDELVAGLGADTLDGGEGNDRLYAGGDEESNGPHGPHVDLLSGGAGDDILYASAYVSGDRAEMRGGSGADRFLFIDSRYGPTVYSPLAAPDRLLDFDAEAGDRIGFGTYDGRLNSQFMLWGGAAPAGFSPELGAVAPGAGADSEYGTSVLQLWAVYDPVAQQTLLYVDRNRDGLVDANDLLIRVDGSEALTREAFDHGSFVAPQLVGSRGADLMQGGALTDSLLGGAGNDTLQGADNWDYLFGGSGDDSLLGGEGGDLLFGGDGNDWLDGGSGYDTLAGGDGDDVYVLDSPYELPVDSGGFDLLRVGFSHRLPEGFEAGQLTGSADADLSAGVGDHWLGANAGDNVLDGGEGSDTASYAESAAAVRVDLADTQPQDTGGSGRDTLRHIEHLEGSAFDDVLHGDAGNNRLQGGGGADWLHGKAGHDTLEGGLGDDVYILDESLPDEIIEAEGGGTDWVIAYRSATLAAGVENGRLITAVAANLYGNALDNLLVAGAGDNTLYGGAGVDTVSYAMGGAVSVSLAIGTAQATGGSGNDRLLLIENLIGSHGNDRLAGNALWNLLDGAQGADTLEGGDGSDTYVIDSALDLIIESNADLRSGGSDWVHSSLATTTLGANLENGLILSGGAAKLFGNAANNILVAGSGDNRINGASGVDTVSYERATAAVRVDLSLSSAQDTGGSGVDTLTLIENLAGSDHADQLKGNALWNRLDGGVGADTLEGGAGSDTYVVDDMGDVVIEAADAGSDWVYSRLSSYSLGANVENGAIDIAGTVDLSGNALDNVLMSGLGDNRLDGGAGLDTASYQRAIAAVQASLLSGSSSGGSGVDALIGIENLTGSSYDDLLIGDGGNNDLRGGSGSDTIRGGDGNDILRGGGNNQGDAAADTFVFDTLPNGNTNYDKIVAFEANGLDKIQLDPAIFSAIGAQLDAGEFRNGSAALDANDFILFDRTTGNLFYDADGSGAGAKVLFAKLINWSGVVDAGDLQIGAGPGG